MSQMGQERRISAVCNISASLPKADVERTFDYRGFVHFRTHALQHGFLFDYFIGE